MDKATAIKILKIRDALIEEDYQEAWHWLYQIASPNFDKNYEDTWTDLEKLAENETYQSHKRKEN